jgi:hypothetical protein
MVSDRRNGIYRGVIAAIVGIAVLCAAGIGYWLWNDATRLQVGYEHTALDSANQYANRADIRIKGKCAPLSLPAKAKCVSEEAESYREGQRKEYDLQAQLVTSAWTRGMGIAAIIGMCASLIGVGLVYVTFAATRRGNEISENARQDAITESQRLETQRHAERQAAEKQRAIDEKRTANALAIAQRNADAAEKLAETSADAAKRQLRAYLGLIDCGVTKFIVGEPIEATFRFKNSGATPAKKVRTKYGFMFYPKGLDGHPTFDLTDSEKVGEISPTGWFNVLMIGKKNLAQSLAGGLLAGHCRIYAVIDIAYSDIFGDPQTFHAVYVSTEGWPQCKFEPFGDFTEST